ncbi:NUMOD4 domain-containing protein [Mycobacterium sp. pUA109]|uniref:NUMOD4 domain-containing protein n=1 Tax=Mycobacterium sp. pUA109 TaxID=3238982 RepID=UPI00351B27D9
MTERWLPVPGFVGRYEVSDQGRVRTVAHTVRCRDGRPYPVQSRLRRIVIDPRDGRRYVALATGRRGRYRTVFVHRLLDEVFGDTDGRKG